MGTLLNSILLKWIAPLIVLCGVLNTNFAQTPPNPGQQINLVSPAGTKFWVYAPPGYNASTPSAMLVNLHGQGQIGDNINLLVTQSSDATPAYLINNNQWNSPPPFIVLSPQLKRDMSIPYVGDQDWPADYINEVIEYVKTFMSVDNNKIYLSGYSLGGQGTLIYAAMYPQKVAGIVTLCGRTDDIISQACSLVDIPIWFLHGTEDGVLNPSNSINMVNAINSCNPNFIKPHLSIVHAMRHEQYFWNPIYNRSAGYNIYNWLSMFTKGDTSNKPPYVYAGTDRKFLNQNSVNLYGDFFDIDGSIESIQWTQVAGDLLTLENEYSKQLKITNLKAGTFEFELRVTDNLGAESFDRVVIQIFNSPALPSISSLTLLNGDVPVGPILDDHQIIRNSYPTSDFNIFATTSSTVSVRFRTNENQNTRTISTYFPAEVLIFTHTSSTKWRMYRGEYLVCATPFARSNASGTEGITSCRRITVIDQYFPKPGFDVALLSSWGPSINGAGLSPTSFMDSYQVFNINSTVIQNSPWTVGGTKTMLNVVSGGELIINSTFTGIINIEGNGVVSINTSQPVMFGSVSPASTVRFGANATAIPVASYGHVILEGSAKTFAEGTTEIAGNLNIETGVVANGALSGTSTVILSGNLNIAGAFNPTRKFNLTLKESLSHTLTLNGLSAFNQLTVKAGASASVSAAAPVSLQLGTATGGGLGIEDNGELQMNNHTLAFTGQGIVNCNQTGQVGFSKGNLLYASQSTALSTLRIKPGADSIQVIKVNGITGGQLTIANTLYVLDSIKIAQAQLNSTRVTLVSTAEKTARIAAFEGTGNLTGTIGFQRYIRSGRMYRYITFPVSGVAVDSLQEYMPVTGNFTGASKGSGLASATPSLFRYENNDWIPYPTTDSTAQFLTGTGYSAFMRNENSPITLQTYGTIHRGDFNFELQAGSEEEDEGWNLLGNPYAAPIEWPIGWSANGVGTSVYVRNNERENDPVLVWDGETGDEEFSGKIAQGQSFWIKSEEASPTLTVSETAKVATGNFYRTQHNPVSSLTITLTKGTVFDRAFLKYNATSKSKFNSRTDAYKRKNTFHNLAVLSSDSVLLAIKSIADSCQSKIGLAIENVTPGQYQISLSGSALVNNREFLLTDLYTGTTVALTAQSHYAFEVTTQPASFGKNRFQLSTQSTLAAPVISIRGDTLISTATSQPQWYLNNIPLAGATQSYLIPEQSGVYHVTTQEYSCIKESAPLEFVITRVSGIEPVTIFPNPAYTKISVTGTTTLTPYSIQDLQGKNMQQGIVGPAQNQIELNLPAGIYILFMHNSLSQRIKLMIK